MDSFFYNNISGIALFGAPCGVLNIVLSRWQVTCSALQICFKAIPMSKYWDTIDGFFQILNFVAYLNITDSLYNRVNMTYTYYISITVLVFWRCYYMILPSDLSSYCHSKSDVTKIKMFTKGLREFHWEVLIPVFL